VVSHGLSRARAVGVQRPVGQPHASKRLTESGVLPSPSLNLVDQLLAVPVQQVLQRTGRDQRDAIVVRGVFQQRSDQLKRLHAAALHPLIDPVPAGDKLLPAARLKTHVRSVAGRRRTGPKRRGAAETWRRDSRGRPGRRRRLEILRS
jgi:hypothetical protein